ncbi:N-acetyltransferase [Psychrobacter sp. WY6]|uniref:N-acetyltransferase n=1 Tax=Psychrobacter sp. WY6 TaxID=2708350 RepID=UPI002022FDB1|nr:N-acetyltransferase [Psychrobacter sp. WY6]
MTKLVYDHTIVPQALGGRGIGSALVKHALNYAVDKIKSGTTVLIVSSYISKTS